MSLRVSDGTDGVVAGGSVGRSTPSLLVVGRRARIVTASMVLVDLLGVVLAYAAAKAIRVDRVPEGTALLHAPVLLSTIPIWFVVFLAYGLYSRNHVIETSTRIPAVVTAITLNIFLVIVVAFAFRFEDTLSRSWLVILWVTAILFIVSGRVLMTRMIYFLNRARWLGLRTLVVGVNGEARTMARVLVKKRELGYDVVGLVGALAPEVDGRPVLGTMENLRETVIANDISAIFVAASGGGTDALIDIDHALIGLGVRIRTSLGVPYLAASRVVVKAVDGMAMLALERPSSSPLELQFKRMLDVGLSALGLLVGLIPMIAIAIAIRLEGKGPIIFAQRRVGAQGELFTMYKFRTMVPDAEKLRAELEGANEADGVLFKMRRDPRITRVGAHLRRIGLDELPQLFNVLLGEMSLVGPRPALSSEVERWSPEMALRLEAKPGLTGLWQVSGRHELAFEDYIRYDLFYVKNWSFALDLQILARTIPAILSRAGSY